MPMTSSLLHLLCLFFFFNYLFLSCAYNFCIWRIFFIKKTIKTNLSQFQVLMIISNKEILTFYNLPFMSDSSTFQFQHSLMFKSSTFQFNDCYGNPLLLLALFFFQKNFKCIQFIYRKHLPQRFCRQLTFIQIQKSDLTSTKKYKRNLIYKKDAKNREKLIGR